MEKKNSMEFICYDKSEARIALRLSENLGYHFVSLQPVKDPSTLKGLEPFKLVVGLGKSDKRKKI